MKENKLVELSMDFAIKIMKLCETTKGHYSIVDQLERSATSIGANIHEANDAHGKPPKTRIGRPWGVYAPGGPGFISCRQHPGCARARPFIK